MLDTKTIEHLSKAYEDCEKAYRRYKNKVLESKGYDVKCGWTGPDTKEVFSTEDEYVEALREE